MGTMSSCRGVLNTHDQRGSPAMRTRSACRDMLKTRAMTRCSETRHPVATGALQMCSRVDSFTGGPHRIGVVGKTIRLALKRI